MKFRHLVKLGFFGLSTVMLRRKKPILATIIITDKCNLTCKHCAVNNINGVMYPYDLVRGQMEGLYREGIRILFLSGGETFLWQDAGKTLRDLVIEAKKIGFYIVNVVTNGTYPIDIPEASLILLSVDGGRENHNIIRGDTYDLIMKNIAESTSKNICLYMAINNINYHDVGIVCQTAKDTDNVCAASFNLHTPYPGTEALSLTYEQKKECFETLSGFIKNKYPIFNLKSAFPYILDNTFPRPCRQCLVLEKDLRCYCGRCTKIPGLCDQCGYMFAAEYTLAFSGKIRVIADMLKTYTKYV